MEKNTHKHNDDNNDRPLKKQKTTSSLSSSSATIISLPVVLGQHTMLPTIATTPKLYKNTLLSSNHGRIPPYCIIVGDRTRVTAIASFLKDVTFLHEHVEKLGYSCKRMSIAVGTYNGTPIIVAEHGMGCASTEIILRELLSEQCMSKTFVMPDGFVRYDSDAKYIIRVGSSAGINNHEHDKSDTSFINAFDLIVSDEQCGISGTDMQALSGGLNWFECNEMIKIAQDKLTNELGFHMNNGWPCLKSDETLSQCIYKHACKNTKDNTSYNVHLGANISKDSLYAETMEESFTKLRKSHNVKSSEMEFATISVVGQTHNRANDVVKFGMVLYVLGTIPGNSFETDPIKSVESRNASSIAALDALHELSLQHIHTKKQRSREKLGGLFGI